MDFNKLYKALLVVLPFHVIITVFFQYKIGIPGFGLYKELLLIILAGMLANEYRKRKIKPVFDKIDYAIFAYMAYLVLITIINLQGIKSFVYGGRYDFEFLAVFLLTRHSSFLLKDKISHYLKLFLYSGGIAILIGLLVRFVIGENILLHFGFSANLSSWSFSEGVPIYHGIEGANVRRFQGIFDGPNQAAFFLITYSGLLFHYLRNKKDYLVYLYAFLVIIAGLVFYTYSRSSLLGIIGSLGFIFMLNIGSIIKKYKTQSAIVLALVLMVGGLFYMRFAGHINEIILRAGSTKGHSERMIIGFNQFKETPLGHGLASSGPGYRLSHDVKGLDEKNFIPESWYVQQLVEGGIIGFLLFSTIMILIAIELYSFSIPFFFSFIAILIMNLFLHTFEASYVSMLMFMLTGLFLKRKNLNHNTSQGESL